MGEEQTVQTEAEVAQSTRISDIYAAAKRLEGIVRKTPLIYSEFFSDISGNATYLKLENLQTTGAFKLRGAYNRISMLTEEEKARGVITASAGNHAQGVAYASQKLGVNAVICMPATTPILKVEATRALGATVILHGNGFDDAYAHSLTLQKEKGYVYIHPFNDRDVLVGQGTIALEVIDALKDVDAILVPVGGGGLLAGTAIWLREFHPEVRIVGVEPSGAASMQAALAAGEPVTLPEIDAFADGTAVARAGEVTFRIASELVDDVVSVPEGALCTEMLELYQVEGIIAEPAGALASTAVARFLPDLPDGPTACVVSGGNNDVSRYDDIVERSSVYEGLRHYFLVTFPQEPGALRHFLDGVLTDGEDIVLFEYTKKNNRETGPALVGIEIQDRARIGDLLTRMEASPLHIEKLEPDSPVFSFLL